jgi:hypothetical protein
MDIAKYEIEVDDPDATLDTLAHIKAPLEALIGCAIHFAERQINYDEMQACLQDYRLQVQVGLQMPCPVCKPATKELIPPDCPGCHGHGWVWREGLLKYLQEAAR